MITLTDYSIDNKDGSFIGMNDVTTTKICHPELSITSNGFWRGEDSLNSKLSMFMVQISLMIIITRMLYIVLRPLKQTRFVVEILAGIILGPSGFGRNKTWKREVFPESGENLIRTSGVLGLALFLFSVSVKMNPKLILKSGKKLLIISIVAIFIPLLATTFVVIFFATIIPANIVKGPFVMFLSANLAITCFPNVSLALSEFDMLNSELGRLALNSALINEYFGWFFMAFFTAMDQGQNKKLGALWSLLSLAALILFIVFIVRPMMNWVIRKVPKGGTVKEEYLVIILLGSLVSSFMSDMIGASMAFGPMMLGLATPNGPPLGSALMERSELIAMEVFMPMMYITFGMRINIDDVFSEWRIWIPFVSVFVVAHFSKLASTMATALFFQVKLKNAFVLGLIMSLSGVLDVVVSLHLWSRGLLDDKAYTVAVLCSCFITAIITPLVAYLYDPFKRRIKSSVTRTISQVKSDEVLQLVTCVHSVEPVPLIINLLQTLDSDPGASGINLCVVNMVEILGRAAPLLIHHDTDEDTDDPVIKAFLNYSDRVISSRFLVKPFTTISPYRTMHQDIYKVANDNQASLIIQTFPLKDMFTKADHAMRSMTAILTTHSPSSVGILVYAAPLVLGRGINRIGVVFWGGSDDREALALSSWMARKDGVTITVHRYIVQKVTAGIENERALDDDAIGEFMYNDDSNGLDNPKLTVIETVVTDQAHTIKAIKLIGGLYDLIIVGKIQKTLSAGLTEWSQHPELGVFGDMLASFETLKTCPVLVLHGTAVVSENSND